MPGIGSRIGRIRVTALLGSGGMGDVWEGYDEALGRRVALKSIRSDRRLDPSSRARFLREARALGRLDHPNICRIHDYVEGEDVDLLVLELIEGRTLRRAIADGLNPAEKLDVAEAIARALDAAHRAGIVHRDLKPDNVMITASAEVKVLDFGLARRFAEGEKPAGGERVWRDASIHAAVSEGDATAVREEVLAEPDEATGRWSDATSAARTAYGTAAGTPLYMSPEQARGEEISGASDLYSFGLLLQYLYSGREPYESSLTPHQIVVRAGKGESLPPDGIRRDIAQLIVRLKELQPVGRPTAAEALRILRNIREKPRRRLQRLAAAAAIAAVVGGAFRYTVDLRRERSVAVDARAEAERRRSQAEELIGFMVGDLRKKLEPLGRLDVLDDAARASLDYFATLRPEELSGEDLFRNATALTQLGEVRMTQGNIAEAIEAFERSVVLASAATVADPSNGAWRLGLGASHFWLGDARRRAGDIVGALEHFEAYRQVAAGLVLESPGNAEYLAELAYAQNNVGTLLEAQGNIAAALENYRSAAQTFESRAASDASNAEFQEDLASTYNKIGLALQKSGELRAARREFEREFEIREALTGRDPAHAGWRDLLATSHAFRAFVLEWLGEEEEAMRQAELSLAISVGLAAHDPTNRNWERNFAVAHTRRANLRLRTGDIAGSAADYAVAREALRVLTTAEPARKSWRVDLAVAHLGEARLKLARGDAPAAALLASAARALLEPLSGEGARDANLSRLLAEARLAEGEAAELRGESAAAAGAWAAALELLGEGGSGTADPRATEARAAALLHLGRRDEANRLRAALAGTGYVSRELERVCRRKGC
jgi:eukaryotic-like serine/threonine-protein kinase